MSEQELRYFATIGDDMREILVEDGRLRIDGDVSDADISALPGSDRQHLRMDGRSLCLFARRRNDGWAIELEGRLFEVRVEDERARCIRELASHGAPVATRREVRAPMPGLIVRVEVEEGQEVVPGDGLIVMEAMKMENELRADAVGTVVSVEVSVGQAVERDAVLLRIE